MPQVRMSMSSRCCCLAFGIVVFLTLLELPKVQSCTSNQYKRNSVCIDCPRCPAGYGLRHQCGITLSANDRIKCDHCTKGMNYSMEYDYTQCLPCGSCSYDQVLAPCTPDHKTICLPSCKSKENYYEKSSDDCQPCSWCCEDGKDVVEDECVKKGNPIKQSCTVHRKMMCTPSPSQAVTDSSLLTTTTSSGYSSSGPMQTSSIGPTGSKSEKEDNKSDIIIILAVVGVVAGVGIIAILILVKRYCTYVRRKQCSHWFNCRCIPNRNDSDDQALCIVNLPNNVIGANIKLFEWFRQGGNRRVKEAICRKLDNRNSFADVARHFNMDEDIVINMIERPGDHPSEVVLNYVECSYNPNLTVQEFLDCIDSIPRKDVSKVLKTALHVPTSQAPTRQSTATSQAAMSETTSPQVVTSRNAASQA